MKNYAWLRTAIFGLTVSPIVTAEPIVKIEQSKITIRGVAKGVEEDFHNIKFAHNTSAAVLPFFAETPDQSEDCLHLRITRPTRTTATDELPVVVHLVGGDGVKASTYDAHFDPVNLITKSVSFHKPIIHVALNYRLSIYGFARLPILKSQKSLNVGMRDQRAGFQWVKDNIAAFGGDPDRITSFGSRAGGTPLHLMTYGGEQGVPFTQVWAMSGPPGTAFNMSSDVTEIHTRSVAETLGCDHDQGDAGLLECMRGVPMNRLTEATAAYSVSNHPPAGLSAFSPSVDGDFLPGRQSVLYKAGRFVRGIPMVSGWTQDDGATNAGPAPKFQTEEDMKTPIKSFAPALTDDDYERLFSLYAASDFEQEVRNYEARKRDSDPIGPVHYFRVARILRDLLVTCPTIDFGFEMWRHSKEQYPTFPGVRHYAFNQSMVTSLFHATGMPYVGVVHGSDIDYIYNNMFPSDQMTKKDKQISNGLTMAFISFAYTGNPSVEGHQPWLQSFSEPEGLNNSNYKLSGPSKINLQLIGGPLGTGQCQLEGPIDAKAGYAAQGEGMQDPLVDSTQFKKMESPILQERQRELERENLLERCAFINSLAEKLEN